MLGQEGIVKNKGNLREKKPPDFINTRFSSHELSFTNTFNFSLSIVFFSFIYQKKLLSVCLKKIYTKSESKFFTLILFDFSRENYLKCLLRWNLVGKYSWNFFCMFKLNFLPVLCWSWWWYNIPEYIAHYFLVSTAPQLFQAF